MHRALTLDAAVVFLQQRGHAEASLRSMEFALKNRTHRPNDPRIAVALALTIAWLLPDCGGMSGMDLEPTQEDEIEHACTEGQLDFRVIKAATPASDSDIAGFAQCLPVAFCLAPRAALAEHHPHRNLLAFFLLQTTRYSWKVSHPGAHASARVGEEGQLQVRLGSWYPENQHDAGSAYAATFYQQPPGSRLRTAMITEPPRIGETPSRRFTEPSRLSKAEARRPLRMDLELRVAHAPTSGESAQFFDFQGRLKDSRDRPKAMRRLRSGFCRFSVELDGARAVLLRTGADGKPAKPKPAAKADLGPPDAAKTP